VLELHERAERRWGQRKATSSHLLSAVEVPVESPADIVLSTAGAVLLGAVGSRLVGVCRSLGYRSVVVVVLWLLVQWIRWMELLGVDRWVQVFPLVVDSVTSSTLTQLLEAAGLLVLPVVPVRQAGALRLATLKRGPASGFARRKPVVHQLVHMELAGRLHRLAVAEPWHRHKLVALASDTQPMRVKVTLPTKQSQMQDRHDEPLRVSA